MSDAIGPLLDKVKGKEVQALARLLTVLDTEGPSVLAKCDLLKAPPRSLRIGITGPPGAGKSTLIGALIGELRKQELSVGVIAVDPSSPFSKGAILGDRLRYHQHINDNEVFVRSVGSRGALGGLSASVWLMARAYDLFQFDVTLIETVGVGQTEMEIMNVADRVYVVVGPEFGDSIQAMKAGLLEIADVFIVNKSDRPGADQMARELEEGAVGVAVYKTIAAQSSGLNPLVDDILKTQKAAEYKKHRGDPHRLQAEATAFLMGEYAKKVASLTGKIKEPADLKDLFSRK